MASQNREQQFDTPQSNFVVATNSVPNLSPMYTKEYIQEVITQRSKESGIDPNLMLAISFCESGYQMKWNSRHWENPDYYTAYGAFQIIKSHEDLGFDRMTLEGNVAIAIRLYLFHGLRDWEQSLNCIQKVFSSRHD